MIRRSHEPGFALLMVLLLVMLAGVALAGIARRSVHEAVDAQSAVDELQRRWAVTSAREALLPQAERLLSRAERGHGTDLTRPLPRNAGEYRNDPVAEVRLTCELAGTTYDLVFTDEQAKLDLNHRLTREGVGPTRAAARRLVAAASAARRTETAVALRPLPEGHEAGMRRLAGFAQVFEHARPEALLGETEGDGLAAALTLWSSGRVNVRRASADVVQRACGGVLTAGEVAALLDERRRDPHRSLEALLDDVRGLDADKRRVLERRLTDRSACHGLWIVARSGSRSWYSLSIGLGETGEPPASAARDQRLPALDLTARYDFSW
jgi:type II secretory pathway component PulK